MMHDSHVGSVVVIDDKKRPIGIVTDRDLALYVLTNELDPESTTVGDCMSSPPVTLDRSAGLSDASALMRRHGVRRLPIVDEQGRLVGIITGDDLVLLLGRELNELAGAVQRGFAVESTAHAPYGSIFGKE
jgi:CBS domain-containing protein